MNNPTLPYPVQSGKRRGGNAGRCGGGLSDCKKVGRRNQPSYRKERGMKREEIRAVIREELQALLAKAKPTTTGKLADDEKPAIKKKAVGVRGAVEELNTQWKERRTHTTKDIK
jgi:hypothetical protein